jgi:hypothetical protein
METITKLIIVFFAVFGPFDVYLTIRIIEAAIK